MLEVDEPAAGPPGRPDGPIPSDVFVEVVRLLIVALATTASGRTGALGAALGACGGYVAGGVLGRGLRRATGRFEDRIDRTPAVTLFAGAVGAVAAGGAGVIAGIAVVVLLPGRWGYPVLGVLGWTGVYAGFQVGARKGEELVAALVVARHDPGPSLLAASAAARVRPVLVDSSAAMDGRLLALARAGFLPGDLTVPRFVLDELQGLAGAADPTRRRRARRGLEVLEAVRVECGLLVLDDEVPEHDEVDAKLVALARRLGAAVLTADRGLTGVAGVEGVRCLDVVRLADGLRAGLVPGEVVRVRIARAGRDPGQGVGFLDDGTMVVVGAAASRVGDEVGAVISSGVPTSKGRLYFATLQE